MRLFAKRPTQQRLPGNRRAVAHAEKLARFFRRNGFPEAEAAPQYCIDEIGSDNFYTYTATVYVGKRKDG